MFFQKHCTRGLSDLFLFFNLTEHNKVQGEIDEFAKDWGLDADLLAESVKEYSLNKKEIIPYIDDLQRSINYQEAREPEANPLMHTMLLVNEALPEYMVEIKKKYE